MESEESELDSYRGNAFDYGYSETASINGGPQTNYTNGEPNVTITTDSFGMRELTHIPGERDYHLPFICRHLQQVKALSAGLALLFCSGLHVIWGIYQTINHDSSNIFGIYERILAKNVDFEEVGLIFSVVIWYGGVMFGSLIVSFLLIPNVRKKNIYYVAALLMMSSSLLFFFSDQFSLLIVKNLGRPLAGLSHGCVIVTVLVQASENSSKEFREMLVIFIGAWMSLSIFLSATIFLNKPMLHPNTEMLSEDDGSLFAIGIVTFVCCVIAIVTNYYYTLETVPFLLKHNYKIEESLYVLGKLKNEPMNSIAVQNDFEALKTTFDNDCANFTDDKALTPRNKKAIFYGLDGRLLGMLSCSVPMFVVVVRAFYWSIMPQDLREYIKLSHQNAVWNGEPLNGTLDNEIGKYLFISHSFLTSVIAGWFVFGFWTTYLANRYNWKRSLYKISSIFGGLLICLYIARAFGVFDNIMTKLSFFSLLLFIYFLSWPLNIFGNIFLADGYPLNLNARSIGWVTFVENWLHICAFAIDINLRDTVANDLKFVLAGVAFAFLGYKLFKRCPNTKGLSLAEARIEYERVLLTKSFGDRNWWDSIRSRVFKPKETML